MNSENHPTTANLDESVRKKMKELANVAFAQAESKYAAVIPPNSTSLTNQQVAWREASHYAALVETAKASFRTKLKREQFIRVGGYGYALDNADTQAELVANLKALDESLLDLKTLDDALAVRAKSHAAAPENENSASQTAHVEGHALSENTIRQIVPADEKEKDEKANSQVVAADDKEENAIRAARASTAKENATNGPDKSEQPAVPTKGPATLLNGRFVRDAAGIYRRQGETRDALADEGTKIRFIDKQMDAFEAGVELAKSKGWSAIEVTGSEQFRAEAWFHAKAAGLDVVGYEPNEKDMKRLEAHERASVQSPAPKGQETQQAAQDITASASEAFDQAVKRGMGVVSINTEKGRYAGKVVYESAHHLLQETGRNTAVIHNKRDIDGDLKALLTTSKALKVQYQDGRGAATTQAKTQDRGR